MWVILNFGTSGFVTDVSKSFGASIGRVVAPLFVPIGLGYWQIVVALISGIAAKEIVVASCGVLFGIQNITTGAGMVAFNELLGNMGFGLANAYSLMVFCLLYIPCMATIATINREVGKKRITFGILTFQLLVAWLVAFVAFHVVGLFV